MTLPVHPAFEAALFVELFFPSISFLHRNAVFFFFFYCFSSSPVWILLNIGMVVLMMMATECYDNELKCRTVSSLVIGF